MKVEMAPRACVKHIALEGILKLDNVGERDTSHEMRWQEGLGFI